MSDHFIEKCSCGVILNQCRCFSPNKTIVVKPNACGNCQKPGAIQVLRGHPVSTQG